MHKKAMAGTIFGCQRQPKVVFGAHPPMIDACARTDLVHPSDVAPYVSSFAAARAEMSRRAGLLHVA